MKYSRIHPLIPPFVAFVATLAGFGCETAFEPSTTAPRGYTFSQDFELERRVLFLGFSADDPVRCMRSTLPINGTVAWKSGPIDASLYEALMDLAHDEARISAYERDTLAIECNDWNCSHDCGEPGDELYDACISTLPEGGDCVADPDACVPVQLLEECSARSNDVEFCYIPEASASVDYGPWRFALSPDFRPRISTESQTLIEAFLEAHEACWSP